MSLRHPQGGRSLAGGGSHRIAGQNGMRPGGALEAACIRRPAGALNPDEGLMMIRISMLLELPPRACYFPRMSTLAEIEEAVGSLSAEDREVLERRLRAMNAASVGGGRIFTGADAVRWWSEMEHLPATEAQAFAEDVEAARRELNRPPTAPRWA